MAAGQPARSGIDFSAFRDSKLARELIERIHETCRRPRHQPYGSLRHTYREHRALWLSLHYAGRAQAAERPGLPVCVTANRDIDHAIALSNMDGAIITTFGDMMRVPGSSTSLAAQRRRGAIFASSTPRSMHSISPSKTPDRPVILWAWALNHNAHHRRRHFGGRCARGLQNFSVYCAHKTTPPALRAIANDPETTIDGFILPGHVATITGLAPFELFGRRA